MKSLTSPVINKYRVLLFFAIVNFCMLLVAVVMGYKLVSFHGLVLSSSIYVLPISYMCNDVIAELYGYRISRAVIWATFSCIFVFSMVILILLQLPAVDYWYQQGVYEQALGGTFRFAMAMILGLLVGDFVNAILLTKWKILLRGRTFWLRSIGATAIGDFMATWIGFGIAFIGILPWAAYVELAFTTYLIKLLFNVICVLPTSVLVSFIKHEWHGETVMPDFYVNPFNKA